MPRHSGGQCTLTPSGPQSWCRRPTCRRFATRFLLRRENRLNAAHLPRKLVQVVVCRATAAQRAAYGAVLADKRLRHALRGKQADVLASIGKLQKICNHPCARPRCICVRV